MNDGDDDRAILWPADDHDRGRVGGKAASLRTLLDRGHRVPAWFVVRPSPTDGDATLDDGLVRAIAAAVAMLAPNGAPLAVRSSAIEEDGAARSFAGQLESFLDVAHADVAARVEAVRRSGESARVTAYRAAHGDAPAAAERGAPTRPAVIVQRMVAADHAGVAFSVDVVARRADVAVVSAVRGLGEALVGGDANGETFFVDGAARIVRREGDRAGLDECHVVEIAILARRIAAEAGAHQDIEWAVADGVVHVLQARPITTWRAGNESACGVEDGEEDALSSGTLAIWDNSNIAESFAGVVSPMTFSFARRAYEEVYRGFCRVMGVPGRRIADSDWVFRTMIGSIRGRVYYNLLNWHRLVAMLPGHAINAGFMERMMGVAEALPAGLRAEAARSVAGSRGRVRDAIDLARAIALLGWRLMRLPSKVKAFHATIDAAVGRGAPDVETMSVDGLAEEYRRLERTLLPRWDTPIVNDFFVMVFCGALGAIAERAAGREGDVLDRRLLAGHGGAEAAGIVDAQPAATIRSIGASLAGDREAIEALAEGDPPRVAEMLASRPALRGAIDDYLARFGDRCAEELKLESPTLVDDPRSLHRAIAAASRSAPIRADAADRHSAPMDADRLDAERAFARQLSGRPLLRLVAWPVLGIARARVRDRENLRFERTRVFGRVRRIVVEIGRRWTAAGVLDRVEDVFMLEIDEAMGRVEGTATTDDLRGLVRVRADEHTSRRHAPAPPSRFETRGDVGCCAAAQANAAFGKIAPPMSGCDGHRDRERRGLGASAGRVRGVARVVRDPRGACVGPAEILVAERTDPGWVMLFASAAAVVVERGSVLSHAAIVARELGLPAVVAVPGLMTWLRDGDMIEVDGARGVVRRVDDDVVR